MAGHILEKFAKQITRFNQILWKMNSCHSDEDSDASIDIYVCEETVEEKAKKAKDIQTHTSQRIETLTDRLLNIYTSEKTNNGNHVNNSVGPKKKSGLRKTRDRKQRVRERIGHIIREDATKFFSTMDEDSFADTVIDMTWHNVPFRIKLVRLMRQYELPRPVIPICNPWTNTLYSFIALLMVFNIMFIYLLKQKDL